MAFPRKLLNDGEEIVLDLRPHWWVLIRPVALVLLLSAAALLAHNVKYYVPLILAALDVVALLWFLKVYAVWSTTSFVVTTDRLISRGGVLSKHGREIPLERLNDISFHQSVFERMIGAGDLMIESGGERGQETFPDIPHPSKVQNVIYREIERARGRDADRMSGHRELSVPEQIDKLDELRRRGVLSQAEFDAKKAQLLDRM
jgi:uncharacterized membrane protein YdbT with pleckstrin-like domain